MKKTFFLLIAAFLFAPAFAQFQVSHETETREAGYSVRSLQFDKTYIIGGVTDYGFIASSDATLVKTKYNGNIIWAMAYGGKKDEVFNSTRPIDPKEDIGYVNLGTTNSFGYGTNDMYFVRTDPNGVPVVSFNYGGERGDEGHCIQVVKDVETGKQCLIMIGETASYSEGAKMFIVKTDMYGQFIDAVIIGNKGNQYGYWIEQTKDGGYIAVGASDYACNLYDEKPNLDIFVVKLKPSLDVEWAKTIGGGKDYPLKDVAYSVKEIEKGYIIAGVTSSFGTEKTDDAFLLTLDYDGNFMWLRNYGYTGIDGANDVLSVENTDVKYQYIFTGYYQLEKSTYAWLLATDYDGNIAWTKGYGEAGTQAGIEMDNTLSAGYVFTGYENSFGIEGSGIYEVVTTDFGDSYCPECELKFDVKSEKHKPCILNEVEYQHIKTGEKCDVKYTKADFKTLKCGVEEKSTDNKASDLKSTEYTDKLLAFPNPANSYVDIQYPESFQYGKLKIYNNTGQLIFEKLLQESNSTNIALENLSKGIYSISVVDKNGKTLTTNLLKIK